MGGLSKRAWEEESDLAAEAASIESSVRLAEQMARMADFEAEGWPTKKSLMKVRPDKAPVPLEHIPAPIPASDDLAAEAASIEYSVRLAEQIARDTFENWSPRKSFLGIAEVKEDRVWPGLTGRTARELRREAKYHMYFVYEHYPDEMKKLVLQVITKGCTELDEKGVKSFVNKVWANKRLQENLQGAMNATYYRELFDGEERRVKKRSVPEIYLDGDNPQIIFNRMKLFLFRNIDLPNRIYLVRTGKGYHKPLSKQLYELFEVEKSKAARRMRNRQRYYR